MSDFPTLASGIKSNILNKVQQMQNNIPQLSPSIPVPSNVPKINTTTLVVSPINEEVVQMNMVPDNLSTNDILVFFGYPLQKDYVYLFFIVLFLISAYFAWTYYKKNYKNEEEDDLSWANIEVPQISPQIMESPNKHNVESPNKSNKEFDILINQAAQN
jgi:hypothetical protein